MKGFLRILMMGALVCTFGITAAFASGHHMPPPEPTPELSEAAQFLAELQAAYYAGEEITQESIDAIAQGIWENPAGVVELDYPVDVVHWLLSVGVLGPIGQDYYSQNALTAIDYMESYLQMYGAWTEDIGANLDAERAAIQEGIDAGLVSPICPRLLSEDCGIGVVLGDWCTNIYCQAKGCVNGGQTYYGVKEARNYIRILIGYWRTSTEELTEENRDDYGEPTSHCCDCLGDKGV